MKINSSIPECVKFNFHMHEKHVSHAVDSERCRHSASGTPSAVLCFSFNAITNSEADAYKHFLSALGNSSKFQ